MRPVYLILLLAPYLVSCIPMGLKGENSGEGKGDTLEQFPPIIVDDITSTLPVDSTGEGTDLTDKSLVFCDRSGGAATLFPGKQGVLFACKYGASRASPHPLPGELVRVRMWDKNRSYNWMEIPSYVIAEGYQDNPQGYAFYFLDEQYATVNDEFVLWPYFHSRFVISVSFRREIALPWTNIKEPTDINADGKTDQKDFDDYLSAMKNSSNPELDQTISSPPELFLDVDRDGRFTLGDGEAIYYTVHPVNPWMNSKVPFDVDKSGDVTAMDVLWAINISNAHDGELKLAKDPPGGAQYQPVFYLDANGDYLLNNEDVELIKGANNN